MGIEITEPEAYRTLLKGLGNGLEPLQVLQETPDRIQDIIQPYTEEQLKTHPVKGKWSPLEIIGHLADVEWNFGIRLRFIVCENQPPIIGYDQDLWVKELQHNQSSSSILLSIFSTLRSFNISLYKTLSLQQMKRVGLHNERGEESIEAMLQMEAGHDLYHIRQLQSYLTAIKS